MRKLIFPFVFLIPFIGFTQQPLQDSLALERSRLLRNNMTILAGWAGANIIQGSISASNATGSDHFFHQMNVYWNIPNYAIAILGSIQAKKMAKGEHSFERNLREQSRAEKILLLNTGLDAAYIMTGLYLKERGDRLNLERNMGYGSSLLLQGSFLLVFDLVQYFENRRIGKSLEKSLGGWQVGPTPNGMGLTYRF